MTDPSTVYGEFIPLNVMEDTSKDAARILAIVEPGDLFTADMAVMERERKELLKKWHPDKNNNSDESVKVTQHIGDLYNKGLEMMRLGTWKREGMIRFRGKNGKAYEIRFRVTRDFELGKMYISDTVVVYLIGSQHKDLFDNAVRVIKGFKYAGPEMEKEFSRYLPKIVGTFETVDSEYGLVISKTPDLVLLRDVLGHYNGTMPDRHVAWVMSCLLNIACYLDFSHLSHNSVTLDTVFISPSLHSAALLGGWWYAVPQESRMLGVSTDIYGILPPAVKDKKNGSIVTDLESIRLTGRELLGDKNGTRLLAAKAAPEAFVRWLRGISPQKAAEDYTNWGKVLTDSYGQRKFVAMEVTADMLYPKK